MTKESLNDKGTAKQRECRDGVHAMIADGSCICGFFPMLEIHQKFSIDRLEEKVEELTAENARLKEELDQARTNDFENDLENGKEIRKLKQKLSLKEVEALKYKTTIEGILRVDPTNWPFCLAFIQNLCREALQGEGEKK